MHTKLYVDGTWLDSSDGEMLDVINPYTEQVYHRVAAASKEDVDRAVQAATKAFKSWKKLSGCERAHYLREMAKAVEGRIIALSEMETNDCGKPLAESGAWACFAEPSALM